MQVRCRDSSIDPLQENTFHFPLQENTPCRNLYAGNDANKARVAVVMCYNMAMDETKIRFKTLHHHPPALHHPLLPVLVGDYTSETASLSVQHIPLTFANGKLLLVESVTLPILEV